MGKFVAMWEDFEFEEDSEDVEKFSTDNDEDLLIKHQSGKHNQASHAGAKKATIKPNTGKTVGSAQEVLSESVKLQRSELYADEGAVLYKYITDGFDRINNHLRSTEPKPNWESSSKKRSNAITEKQISTLDSVFERTSVASSESMVVHRGMTLPVNKKDGWKSWVSQLKTGDIITDKGFVSTSIEKSVAENFATSGVSLGVMFTIKVPKGKKAMAGAEYEKELVFNRGTKMKVQRVIKYDGVDKYSPNIEVIVEVL